MSKHTPGPWYHDFASGMKNGNAALIEYFVRRYGDSVSIAADIVDPDTCNPSEANARLIAAAPDLLEAAVDLVSRDFGYEGWDDACEQAALKLCAAVAKATGGSDD